MADATDESAPEVRKGRGLMLVWAVPIVAVVVAGGLAYRTISQQGPTIRIVFKTAAGVEAGKTTVRFRDVVIGQVDSVDITDDLSGVVVTANMNLGARSALTDGARFWVVRPRIGAGGISGLSTLISGAYIALDPGPEGGKQQLSFQGLDQPPMERYGEKGVRLVLESDALHGLGNGSPVYHRGIQVGLVNSDALTKDKKGVEIQIFVREPHDDLVFENTRFWNVSGVDVSASLLRGVEVDVDSVRSIIEGGVAFATPGAPGTLAKAGASYHLYRHRRAAFPDQGMRPGRRFAVESPSLGSIETGDRVYYREVAVGRVLGHEIHSDSRSVGILVHVDAPYDRIVRANTVFWNASGISANLGLKGLHIHSESLTSLLAGGVAFATPNRPGARAAAGSVFELHPEVDEDWLKWSPAIALGSGHATGGSGAPAQPKPDDEEKLHHHKGEAAADPKSHHWFHGLFHHDS